MNDLEPCTALEFDATAYACARKPGWSYRIIHGHRCEGYLDGRLVLLMTRRGDYADHFRAPPPKVERVPEEGFRYR
jgi:hypothetical protein